MAKKYWWEEDENTTQTQAEQQPQNQEKKTYWWEPEAVASTIGNDVVNRVNAWIEGNNAYLSEYQNRFAGRKGNYDDAYVSDSASWLESFKEQGRSLNKDAQDIIAYMDQYKDYLDADWVSNVTSALHSARMQHSQLLTGAKKDNEYWSQWETEDDYKKDMATAKDYEAKSTADLDALAKELEQLDLVANEYATVSNQYFSVTNNPSKFSQVQIDDITAKYFTLVNNYGTPDDFNAKRNEKKLFMADAKRIQEGITLSGVINNEDFDANSGYISPENRKKDETYEYINDVNGSRKEINKSIIFKQAWGVISDAEIQRLRSYDRMNEDEIAIYNYYYAKDGKAAAEKYLDNLQYTLNAREATEMFSEMEDKTILELAFGVAAGLDQFASGMDGLWNSVTGNDEYTAPSSTQMASGMVREDLADDGPKLPNWMGGASLGQVGYDVTTTTANMAPSILASVAVGMVNPVAGQWVGSTLMGASAAGNAYQEALNLGYDKSQARAYSTLIGASEAGLQYLLGGISKFGGKLSSGVVTKMLDGVDNALFRTAGKLAGSVISEGVEEGLQEILTPWFKNLTLHMDENVNWSEVAYSSLLGALTAGFMEGPTTIAGEVGTYNTGKKLQARDISAERLAKIGKTFSADTVAYQLAGRVNENTGAYTMGRLFNEIGATLTEQNISEITEALVAKGMSESVARKNAEVLAYVVEGGQMSDGMIAIIEANDVLAEVARTTLVDSNTTLNQRTQGYNEMLKALAEEMTSPKAKQAKQTQENAPATDTVDGQTEIATDSQPEADTVDTSPAKVMSIADIGKKTIKLEDGSEVNVKDADLSPDDGVRIETIASIDGISTEDANFVLNTLRANTGASAQMDSIGAKEAYKYGFYGFSQEHMAKHGVFANSLTESQRQKIYEVGQKARQKQIEKASPKGTTKERGIYFDHGGGNVVAIKDADKSILSEKKRSAGVQAAVILNKLGIGGDIYFFESYRNSEGKLVYKDKNGVEKQAPNGWFSESNGSIHIDLNAGVKGDGLVLFTLAHELTHFVEEWSPKKYKVLADFLIENYEKGHSMNQLVLAKQKHLSDMRGKEVSYDEAYSEVIADSMEAMLADGNVIEKIMELKAKDEGLVAKIKQFFDNLLVKIRNTYKGLTPDSAEGKAVQAMTDSIEKIQQLFAEALVEASNNFQTAMESVVEENAEAISTDEIITDGAVVTDGEGTKYSIKSMKHDIADGQMFEDLKTHCNWTDSQVNELRKQLVSLVEYMTPHRDILDMNETYDREGRRFSPYKPNSDPLYKISMDFSTLCSKRLLTQFVIEQLQLRENRPMSAEEQMAVRDMLNEYRKVEKGLQVACAMCYVEAARLKSPKQIQRWLNDPTPHLVNYFAQKNTEFNATVKKAQADFKESKGYDRDAPKKDMKPADVKELNEIGPKLRSQYKLSAEEQAIVDRAKALPNSTYLTAGNLADLSESEPVIYNAYTSFVRTATRSKSLEKDEPYYYGDSRRDNGNGVIVTDSFIEAVNRENGMRFSSWSDWRIVHLLDYITAVIDNSVRGAAMHGYTKFGDEVRVLGKTGMMFNMSGVTGTQTGLNEDGSLNFSETESIDVNEAIQLRDEFPETAGLQCIGVSDAHIIALLRSDIIDYVIPYHVSGLNADLRRMAKIYGWDDYTGTQNASIDKSIKFEDSVDQENWHKEPAFSEFFVGYNTGMSGIEAMRASADRYVQMCKDRGLKPKFEQFVGEENYWKLLIDRKMINQQTGKLIQQKAVTPTFDFDVIKSVVDNTVENYDAGLEGRALNHIVENWDSIPQRIKDLKKKGGTKAKKTKKAVDALANQTLAAQPSTGDKLSMRVPVEETKDLLAYHNITPQLLEDVLSRNSLLMPSLAVTNKGMTDFGDISLLFDKATIDPSANKQNKLYGSDAWTPMQTSLKMNAKFDTNKTVRAVNTMKNRIGSKYAFELLNITPKQFKEAIIKADGNIYEAYAHNIGVQAAYAMENEIISKIPTNKDGSVNKEMLQKQLDKTLDTDDGWRQYRRWLNNISDTVITSYDQATNEDILRHMKAQPATAKTFKLSETGELIVPAKEYSSIDELRNNKNRLSENADEATKAVASEFLNFAKKIGNTQQVVDAINASFDKRYSVTDIIRSFNAKGIKITTETASDLQALYRKAVELPTQYFEAKPGREVSLEEVKTVVMPTGTEYAELKSKLEELGISVIEYNGTNESRVEALNSVEDLKFSDRDSEGNQLSAEQQEFFKDSKVRDKKGNLLTVYHGTTANFNIFKKGDVGFHFGTKGAARGRAGYGKNVNIKAVYLNITNPIVFDEDLGSWDADYRLTKELYDRGILSYEEAISVLRTDDGKYKRTTEAANKKLAAVLMEKGYDGIAYQNTFETKKATTSYIAFSSNQAKETSNISPTSNPDIRFQDRADESVSNRSLLANAFEGLAQNDIEKNKIQEYKSKIDLINSEEKKLSDLNAKIKELSFAKGPRDTKKIRDLQFEARQTANRINTLDKVLLRLEASKPLQDVLDREKKKAYQKAEQRGKEALDAYKERAAKTQRELIERWQDSRKKGIESRNKTAMRHKIKDVVNELNQYLLRGTKDRHVPESLQKAVAEALNAVNMDTVGADERIAKLKAEMMKAKTPEQIQEISRKIDHIQEMGDRMNDRLKRLKDAYDDLLKSPDENTRSAYDEVIHNKLESVIDKIGNTPLRDMTLAQLEDVYDMYRMVLKAIRDVNKSFKDAKNQSISTRANAVMAQVKEVGGKHKLSAKILDGIKKFSWNNLKPVYAFEHIGSVTLTEAFKNVRAGEDVWAMDITEAREFYLDKIKKYQYDSWDFQKQYEFQSTSGMDFSLNLEQILSLYAYSKRDQAADHLKYGGIVFDESTRIIKKTKMGISLEFNPTEATAYNISEETLSEIISKLTDEQKAFADEMQDYLSAVMGAKGNEVSMAMYDIKLFKDKNYFPLKSAQQFMEKAREQQKGDVKIKNSGFSKETVPKAKNPIVLTPFMDVWAGHVNDMSMYHAFVLPLEDFYRIYNYKTPSTDETLATEGVNQYIQNAYGRAATAYIDQLLKDLNGGARTDSTTGFINKMIGLFKKGSVFASLSVVVQQPSAIARATALVDTKYFIGPKVDHKRHKALWDEVKKYAPVAIIKEMGYFDTNMGKSTQDFIKGKEYSGFKEKMKALVTDSNYRDEVLSKAPALADELAWCGIWEAVKRETKAKNPSMDVKSEAFLKQVGERFTEVITKTQVYDSVLARSGMMRSKDTGMKMATAFMAEPTTSINMIADALLQGKRGNRKYARTAIGAVIASQILNSILVSFVYAGRDDDEDETYPEKYIGTLTGEIFDSLNPATYIPFIKDIVSIVQGYDVERSDMAIVSDLWKAWENLSNDNISAYRKVEGFAGSIAQIFGLPVKNIMRDARGIYQTIMSFVNGEQTTSAGVGYAVNGAITGNDTSKQQQLYEAYLSGDAAQIARVSGRFEDQKAIDSAMRTAIKDHYESGDIDYETAKQYLVDFGGLEEDDAYWKVEEWKYEAESGEDFHKYNDFYEAVKTGSNLKAVIKMYTDNGIDEKALASQITSYFKPLYKEMSKAERAGIKGYLLNAYQLLGYNRYEKSKDIDNWLKD